jgi:hypothetical protein
MFISLFFTFFHCIFIISYLAESGNLKAARILESALRGEGEGGGQGDEELTVLAANMSLGGAKVWNPPSYSPELPENSGAAVTISYVPPPVLGRSFLYVYKYLPYNLLVDGK